jgi:AP-1 complex subunit mu
MASGCSAVFLLDGKGKLLIARNFRGDIPMSAAERFVQRLLEEEDDSNARPVVEQEGTTFCYTKENSVYFVATTNNNANAAMILAFLYHTIAVFRDYLKVVEEETIRDNFVIIYESVT